MNRRLVLVAIALAVALVGSACDDDGESAAPASTAATGDPLDLKGVCPDPIVVQKDWQPESEHGFLYNLVGADYQADTDRKRVTGPLVAQGRAPEWTSRSAPAARRSASSRCLR
jgi:hypothetical protein